MADFLKWWLNPLIVPQQDAGAVQGVGQSLVNTQPGQATQPGTLSRPTGAGPDGVVQPSAVAGDTHEGEWVFNEKVTKVLSPELLDSIAKSAERGDVDSKKLNTLRNVFNVSSEMGMRHGTKMESFRHGTKREDFRHGTEMESFRGGSKIRPRGFQAGTTLQNFTSPPTPTVLPTSLDTTNQIDTAGAGAVTDQPLIPTGEDIARQRSLGTLSNIAEGISPQFRTLSQLTQSQIAGRGAAAKEAAAQEALQTGASTAERRALLGDVSRQTGAEQAQAAAQLAVGEQQRQESAAGTLASQSLAGQQFEEQRTQFDERLAFDKERFGSQEDWNEFDRLLQINPDDAARKYKDITGGDIDVGFLNDQRTRKVMGEDFNILQTQYDDAITRGDATGDYTEASAIYDQMKDNPNFTTWLAGKPPGWETLSTFWAEDNLPDVADNINTMITQNNTDEDLAFTLTEDNIKTVLQTQLNREPTDDEVKAYFDSAWFNITATEEDRIIKELSNTESLKQFFDTDEEMIVARETINDLVTDNLIDVDPLTGAVTAKTDSIMQAWENPKTEHIFRDELSLDDGRVQAFLQESGDITSSQAALLEAFTGSYVNWDQASISSHLDALNKIKIAKDDRGVIRDTRDSYLKQFPDGAVNYDEWFDWYSTGATGDPPSRSPVQFNLEEGENNFTTMQEAWGVQVDPTAANLFSFSGLGDYDADWKGKTINIADSFFILGDKELLDKTMERIELLDDNGALRGWITTYDNEFNPNPGLFLKNRGSTEFTPFNPQGEGVIAQFPTQ